MLYYPIRVTGTLLSRDGRWFVVTSGAEYPLTLERSGPFEAGEVVTYHATIDGDRTLYSKNGDLFRAVMF